MNDPNRDQLADKWDRDLGRAAGVLTVEPARAEDVDLALVMNTLVAKLDVVIAGLSVAVQYLARIEQHTAAIAPAIAKVTLPGLFGKR